MSLTAPYTIEFPFRRTAGPKIGAFLAGLREARLFGVRTARGVLWALIAVDGTAGRFFHCVDVGGDRGRIRTGLRLRAPGRRWHTTWDSAAPAS